MIDEYDITLIRGWLKKARTQGTRGIRIVVGPLPDTWLVSVGPCKEVSDCKYRCYQGDYNVIGCQVDGTLCLFEDCDMKYKDPTGFLRERMDQGRKGGGDHHESGADQLS